MPYILTMDGDEAFGIFIGLCEDTTDVQFLCWSDIILTSTRFKIFNQILQLLHGVWKTMFVAEYKTTKI